MASKFGKTVYNTRQWRSLRARVLEKANYLCAECVGQGFTKGANEVHHVLPLETHKSLAFVESNLVALCAECHKAKRAKPPRSENEIKWGDLVDQLL